MGTVITSIKNEQIKSWHKLQKKKYRERTASFLVEGEHLVEEVLNSDYVVEAIILSEAYKGSLSLEGLDVTRVTESIIQLLAMTPSPQGIMAVVKVPKANEKRGERILIMDEVQDPGNVGTMIRTADAFGFDTVILGEGSADLYNDKVIRATQGSLFHINVIRAALELEIDQLKNKGYALIVSTLEEAKPLEELPHLKQLALVVGNEGRGVSRAILDKADFKVKIPITGEAESLNVSVACGIMLHHLK